MSNFFASGIDSLPRLMGGVRLGSGTLRPK
jgi:hypothetical protein